MARSHHKDWEYGGRVYNQSWSRGHWSHGMKHVNKCGNENKKDVLTTKIFCCVTSIPLPEQIKVNITKSAVKGIDTIDIQLKPEDLGKVQVKMQISKDGKLQADIVVSRQETLDVLQKELSSLTKAFTDAGFDADNRSFNFSLIKLTNVFL